LDRSRIRQAVQNLVDNALKYSSEGLPIEVSTHLENSSVLFQVKDQGPGIPEGGWENLMRGHIAPGSRSESRSKSPGLGLKICRHLVEIHGGEVGVRNNPDKGATFWFRLPLE
jgi:two-component system sensor histidine kinase KdpD